MMSLKKRLSSPSKAGPSSRQVRVAMVKLAWAWSRLVGSGARARFKSTRMIPDSKGFPNRLQSLLKAHCAYSHLLIPPRLGRFRRVICYSYWATPLRIMSDQALDSEETSAPVQERRDGE